MTLKVTPFKTKDGRTLVYFQGLYLTEEEKEFYIQQDLNRQKRCQEIFDRVAGVSNATDAQIILKLFEGYCGTLNSEISTAKNHLIHLKKELNTEVFDKDNLLNTSILVKRLYEKLLAKRKKVDQMYYALGNPVVRLTEGKEIQKYLNELNEITTTYRSFRIFMSKVHHRIHNKKGRG